MISVKELLTSGKWQAAILILGLFLYLVSPSPFKPFIGLLVGIYLVASFLFESYENAREKGWKEELKGLGTTLLGILLLFAALRFVLNTETPISAVVSCSMVPEIARGDLIIVKGEQDYNAGGEVNGSILPFFQPNSKVLLDGREIGEVQGSMFSYCLGGNSQKEVCLLFASSPERFADKRGDFVFNYGVCSRKGKKEPCVVSVSYEGRVFDVKEGDVLVYVPAQGTLFSNFGDIIHRAVLKVRDGNKTYYLTKGDNNNVFDVQFYANGYNVPPEQSEVRGKVFFKIPLLGYYKIFITPYLQEEDACRNPLTYVN